VIEGKLRNKNKVKTISNKTHISKGMKENKRKIKIQEITERQSIRIIKDKIHKNIRYEKLIISNIYINKVNKTSLA
jgi:hypothetical protein